MVSGSSARFYNGLDSACASDLPKAQVITLNVVLLLHVNQDLQMRIAKQGKCGFGYLLIFGSSHRGCALLESISTFSYRTWGSTL